MSSSLQKLVGITAIALMLISQASAQGGATGAITGTVQDTTGAIIANAEVQITNQDTKLLERTVKTGADGSFTAPLLPVGTYTVTIHSAGFAQADFPNIAVRVTETTRLIAKLSPQAVQQKIEVQAEVQTVDTTDATTGQAIDTGTVRALPLATQNFQQLLTLSTGAQGELNAASQLGRGSVRIFVNGQREDNNNYLIEGISNTDYNVAELTNTPLPNPDVVQEFKVQTSLYDASQGRNGGGNINAVLKSGTNTFHGDAYEFFRNTVLDANEFFLNQSGSPRPVIKQNIFGGSLGGPVVRGGEAGILLSQLPGHSPAQWRFPGNTHQHLRSLCPRGRSRHHSRCRNRPRERPGAGERRSGSGFSAGLSEQSVRRSRQRLFVPAAQQHSHRHVGWQPCSIHRQQAWQVRRRPVHGQLGPRLPRLQGQSLNPLLLLQLRAGYPVRRRRITGFLGRARQCHRSEFSPRFAGP